VASEPVQVGIWERKEENGRSCFVRRLETMNDWHLWANLGRIEAKGVKRRVVLIGESVARGYLYDPEFTPAQVLERMLEPQFGPGELEVLDLARTNLGYEVRELALAALALEPDLMLIFAGNNWGIAEPEQGEIAEIEAALTQEGMVGAKRITEALIERKGRRVVREVAQAYAAAGVPLVWLIPEYNLGDWRDPITNAQHLGAGENRKWLLLLEAAERALREGDYAAAEALAQQMVALDQGVCVAGLYILAECRRRAGDREMERQYLEQARDAASWDSSRTIMPRPYSVTQNLLRDEPGKYNSDFIDVRDLFREYLHGEIPNRRMFLDYCHLTTEGIQVAMAAAASFVLRKLKGVEVPWSMLLNDDIVPTPETEAEASFLAAIHNAHWWQSYDLVHHYCARALSLSPHVSDLMLNYIELQTCHWAPMRMSEPEDRIFKLGSPLIHRYLLRTNMKKLDKVLLDAVADSLMEAGFDGRELLDRLRREGHSVALGNVNLLDYYYVSAANQPMEDAWLIWMMRKGYMCHEGEYYQAYWPESRFLFVGEANRAVQLCLTCRLPDPGAQPAPVSIRLNGEPQLEIVIDHEWSTWEIDLPGDVVHAGLNEVTVRWPMPEFDSRAGLERVIHNLCERKFLEFYPVFGDIHSFTASSSTEVSRVTPAESSERIAVAAS
jgi:hypothetical protein